VHYPARQIVFSMCIAWTILGVSQAQECPCRGYEDGIASGDSGVPLRPDFMSGAIWGDEPEAGFGNNVAACSGPFCSHTCRSEGIYFTAELVFVDVWQPAGQGIAGRFLELNTAVPPPLGRIDPGIDPAMRYELGYLTCDGLGAQVRYWEFDNSGAASVVPAGPADPNLVLHAWDVSVLDVEVVKKSMVTHQLDATISGGYRFARYEEATSLRRDNAESASLRSRFIGNGVTAALGFRNQLTSRFSLLANGRTSLLFGGQNIDSSAAIPSHPLRNNFDTRYIIESQFGVTYEHAVCGGGYWFGRGGYEVQYWDDFVVPVGRQTEPASTLFHGLFIAVGFQR